MVPYLAYARQDKPTKHQREPTTAKLVADVVKAAGVDALVRGLRARTSIREVRVAVSHCLSQRSCLERLVALERELGLDEVVVTDSVPQTEAFRALGSLRARGLADVLCRAVDRVHQSRSVSDVVWSLDGLAGRLPEQRQG